MPPDEVVVYTVGVWDLLHPGHLDVLVRLRNMGTRLVVGVVGDDAIARYKRRPIMTLAERAAMIGSLQCVDEVLLDAPLPDETSLEMLDVLGFSFLAKSFSPEERERGLREHAHLGDRFVEAPRGEVRLSTTDILRRVVARLDACPADVRGHRLLGEPDAWRRQTS